MHTESDARKLWCPLVRLVVITNDSNNNVLNKASFNKCLKEGTGDARIPVGSYCIASSCMMWQWVDDEFEYLFSPPENDEWTHAPYLSGEGRKCDRWQREKKNRRGFCGLSRPFYIPTGNCGGGKP